MTDIDDMKADREAGTKGPNTFWMWSFSGSVGRAGFWTGNAPGKYEGNPDMRLVTVVNGDTYQAQADQIVALEAEVARLREAAQAMSSAIGDWSRPSAINGMTTVAANHPLLVSRQAFFALGEKP